MSQQVIITYSDNSVDKYITGWNPSTSDFTDSTDPYAATVYNTISDATTISDIEGAIVAQKGSESHPQTTPPPHH